MKIDYVIVSCDDNKMYYDFWDVIKPIWINHIKIKPILVKISDKDFITDNGDHIVHEIKKINNINTGLQSQIARMYVTKYYLDKVCLTSDIDMIPLSEKYFNSDIESYDQESLLIFSSDAYTNNNRYPICYNAGKGQLFAKILNIDDLFSDYCERLIPYNWGWDTDEFFFGKMVNEFQYQNKIIKLNRGWKNNIAINRIDRVNWSYDPLKVKKGEYVDAHSLRPYSIYNKQINELIKHIL